MKQEKEYLDAVNKIIIFPGSKELYERQCGYDATVIDTRRIDKGVSLATDGDDEKFKIKDTELRNWLVNEGIEAIINATRSHSFAMDYAYSTIQGLHVITEYYGLPVKKAKRKWTGW